MKPNRLGLDVGNVLVLGNHKDIMEKDGHLFRKPTDDAFEVVSRLISSGKFKAEDVFIVSACFPNTERKTREWLQYQRFCEITGASENNWYFVRHRSDKAPLCRALGINYFVDDRLDVLDGINSEVSDTKLFAFSPTKPLELEQEEYITVVNTFLELELKIKDR